MKPGQLDINQIEAQVGGGRVEIKDVEFDPDVSLYPVPEVFIR